MQNLEQSTKGATSLTQGATLCNKIKFVQSPKGTQSIAQGVNPVKKIQFNSNPKEVKLFIN